MNDFEPLIYTYADNFIRTLKEPPEPFGNVFLNEETAAKSIGISVDRLNYWCDKGQISIRYLFTPSTPKMKQTAIKIFSMNELQQFERLSHHS